ncbi:MAG: D-glycero-beta-D-manno-heptose-7-phosphate kinase [Thermodesulfobacteriota bacterium]
MENLTRVIGRFSEKRVVVLGDVMLDEYVWGSVARISPEAPVPVVLVHEETATLGGAGNVVNNLAALGGKVSLLSVTGAGPFAAALGRMLARIGADTRGVLCDSSRPTTRKTRVMAESQQVVRIDRENPGDIIPDQEDALTAALQSVAENAGAVLLSDYGKGVLTPGMCRKAIALCSRLGIPSVVDPKGRDFSKYSGAFLITPNKKEAALAAGMEITGTESLFACGQKLLNDLSLTHVAITLGKEGMALFSQGEKPLIIKAEAKSVFDVSGAGDTVLAVLGLSLAAGADFATAARIANTAAGIVVGKVGTATVSRAELLSALDPRPDLSAGKTKSLAELSEICAGLKRRGKKIVFTNGCFDLLHAGHVAFLAASKRLGDVLVVALDDDASVSAVKGPGRPVIRERDRVSIISALDAVDFVTVFSTDALFSVLQAVAPDVITKGGNYSFEELAGREQVESRGGRAVLIPVDEGLSSTAIIRAIQGKD